MVRHRQQFTSSQLPSAVLVNLVVGQMFVQTVSPLEEVAEVSKLLPPQMNPFNCRASLSRADLRALITCCRVRFNNCAIFASSSGNSFQSSAKSSAGIANTSAN